MTDRSARVAAVVLAGGSGTRLGADGNKVYLDLGGRPMLAWSLATLDAHPEVATLVVAVRAGDEADFARCTAGDHGASGPASDPAASWSTPVRTVVGGATRSASERAALDLLAPQIEAGEIEVVLIHDGARPFATPALVDAVIDGARTHGGAVPGLVPDRDLFERSDDPHRADALPTEHLRRVQTPQGFGARPLLDAHRRAAAAGFEGVDTSEVVARFGGVDAVVVAGHPDNVKVTTPADLALARHRAEARRPPGRPLRLDR